MLLRFAKLFSLCALVCFTIFLVNRTTRTVSLASISPILGLVAAAGRVGESKVESAAAGIRGAGSKLNPFKAAGGK